MENGEKTDDLIAWAIDLGLSGDKVSIIERELCRAQKISIVKGVEFFPYNFRSWVESCLNDPCCQ